MSRSRRPIFGPAVERMHANGTTTNAEHAEMRKLDYAFWNTIEGCIRPGERIARDGDFARPEFSEGASRQLAANRSRKRDNA